MGILVKDAAGTTQTLADTVDGTGVITPTHNAILWVNGANATTINPVPVLDNNSASQLSYLSQIASSVALSANSTAFNANAANSAAQAISNTHLGSIDTNIGSTVVSLGTIAANSATIANNSNTIATTLATSEGYQLNIETNTGLSNTYLTTIANNTANTANAIAGSNANAANVALQTAGNISLSTIATNTSNAAGYLSSLVTSSVGSATSANQITGNTSLGTIATNTTNAATTLATIASNTANASSVGLSTSALQSTGNGYLSTIATNSGTAANTSLQTAGNASLASIVTNTASVANTSLQAAGNASLATIATNSGLASNAVNQGIELGYLNTLSNAVGTDATGVAQPAGGAGQRGWLSGIYSAIKSTNAVLPASLGQKTGANSTSVVLASDQVLQLGALTATSIGDVADSQNDNGSAPVKFGGVYNSTRPTYTTGERTTIQTDSKGNIGVVMMSGNATPQINVVADGQTIAGNNVLWVGASNMLLNGAGKNDQQRNNLDLGAILTLSAATATSGGSATQTNFNGRGIWCFINVTALSGFSSVVFYLQNYDTASSTWVNMLQTASITTTGTAQLSMAPGLAATANVSANNILSRSWRVTYTAVGTGSITATVGANCVV